MLRMSGCGRSTSNELDGGHSTLAASFDLNRVFPLRCVFHMGRAASETVFALRLDHYKFWTESRKDSKDDNEKQMP